MGIMIIDYVIKFLFQIYYENILTENHILIVLDRLYI